MPIKIISAGAGSGKTYRLTSELVQLLKSGVRANGIIATTFTQKAAAELQERVRVRLLQDGLTQQADEINNALIGTVHGLGVKLLRRFAYEAGVSPQVDIIADEDQQVMFNQALAMVLPEERVTEIEHLADKLGFSKKGYTDWRKEVKTITDIARANDFSEAVLLDSRNRSYQSFSAFLEKGADTPLSTMHERLAALLAETIDSLQNGEDHTLKTKTVVDTLRQLLRELRLRDELHWHQWMKIAKIEPGAKSRDDVALLKEWALQHEKHPAFHSDIQAFIYHLFDVAIDALREYEQYKKRRGLIDYTDMETLVYRLLDHPDVHAVLSEELDLLMVDEFQDTSPLQLALFLRLSRFARHAVWVGDPKQSIYGFRGAEPRLMQAIIDHAGGIKPEDIQQFSWRSRQDIVYTTNAIFSKAFAPTPVEQIALTPKRTGEGEPLQAGKALVHWHFEVDDDGKPPAQSWIIDCIATSLRQWLDNGTAWVLPKGEKEWRRPRPGDVAILCRSNAGCQAMANALHRAGLKAALSRTGLLLTAEAKLTLACLKYLLNYYDSLAVAEIILLAQGTPIEDIVEDRMEYLAQVENKTAKGRWAESNAFISRLNHLRAQVVELSATEILNLLLETLDLRRIIAAWGNAEQRLDNVEMLRHLAHQYEEACNRLHSASTLGGMLLWLNDLENAKRDYQGWGENPDAVNVLTYHKSKGLEWPAVICSDLGDQLRADLWGAEIVADTATIDLDNVLEGRWLRYWVNPYGDANLISPLSERLDQSLEQALKTRQSLQEEARLLYVGITRARDYLILPSAYKPTRWLNRVWHDGNEDLPTLDSHSSESPWHWDGYFIDNETETYRYPRTFPYATPETPQIYYLEPRHGRLPHAPFQIDLHRRDHGVSWQASLRAATFAYAAPLPCGQVAEAYQDAKLVKAFLHADHGDYPAEERTALAEGLIKNMAPDTPLNVETLLKTGEEWRQWLQSRFAASGVWRKYPLRYFHGAQLFDTIADLVLDTAEGLVLIQHSSFAGDAKGREKKAIELGPWFSLSKAALEAHFQRPVAHTLVHFVLACSLTEVDCRLDPPALHHVQLELL
ncbi:MAG: UvrD-helicase domain-containing protein [Saprospiraceae bacterium]|nr:UvrD-helicase domain-containing protein [Saprospiraceae bacterium]